MQKSDVQIITSELGDIKQAYAVAIFNIKGVDSNGLDQEMIDLIKNFADAFNVVVSDKGSRKINVNERRGRICTWVVLEAKGEKMTLEAMKKNATDLFDQFKQLVQLVEDNHNIQEV